MKINLEEFPPPDNVNTVLQMDANFKNLLKKEGKNAIIDQDAERASVQHRLRSWGHWVPPGTSAPWSAQIRWIVTGSTSDPSRTVVLYTLRQMFSARFR